MVSRRGSRGGDHTCDPQPRQAFIAAHSIVPSSSGVVLGAFDDHAEIPHWPGHPLDGGGGLAAKAIGRLIEKLSDAEALRLKPRFAD
jgi:hypothetical protein